MHHSDKMKNDFFFLVFQEVFFSISGVRNSWCWKCREAKSWKTEKLCRCTSKVPLDFITPLDPLIVVPGDFTSSKQCHGSGLPAAVLVYWFLLLWAEKFTKIAKISLIFCDNLMKCCLGDSKSNFLSYLLKCLSQRCDDVLVLVPIRHCFYPLVLTLVSVTEPEISTFLFMIQWCAKKK